MEHIMHSVLINMILIIYRITEEFVVPIVQRTFTDSQCIKWNVQYKGGERLIMEVENYYNVLRVSLSARGITSMIANMSEEELIDL